MNFIEELCTIRECVVQNCPFCVHAQIDAGPGLCGKGTVLLCFPAACTALDTTRPRSSEQSPSVLRDASCSSYSHEVLGAQGCLPQGIGNAAGSKSGIAFE